MDTIEQARRTYQVAQSAEDLGWRKLVRARSVYDRERDRGNETRAALALPAYFNAICELAGLERNLLKAGERLRQAAEAFLAEQ